MAGVLLQLQSFAVATLSLLILLLGFNPSLFLSGALPFHASDSISAGRSLSCNQTVVSRGSMFELGFFTPGNSRYYVGIWYKNIPVQTVIWVANRETPLSSSTAESSELKLSQDGNLVLVSPSNKIPVWSSNITSRKPGSTVALLLDTGNLVLKGESHGSPSLLWQSFDHPTDTWTPDMFWGMNKLTGEYSQAITAWKNSQDPAPGIFSHRMKPDGSNCFINVWNGSVVYDETGDWGGDTFAFVPQMTMSPNVKFRFVETRERKYMACTTCNRSTPAVRMVMHFTGQMKIQIWLDDFQKWLLIFTKPSAQCDVYSICGAFGACDQMRSTPCSCLLGFEPKFPGDWDLGDWSGGCVRRSPLQCEEYYNSSSVSSRRAPDVFSLISDVKLPTDPRIKLPAATEEECKVACSHDCGCSAYAYDGSTCLTWIGQLHNLQKLSWGADGHGGALHLRLAASEQQQHSRTRESKIVLALTIMGSVLAVLILISSITLFTMKYWRSSSDVGEAVLEGNHSLFHFKYSELQKITNKFSTLLGRGGFGSVFAGMLPNSGPVAVKRLQGLQQGEKQFRAEVMTLGKVQHANLVRLRGFCAEGDKRLLVYDYMPGGSLDSHLFNVGAETPCLDWRTRFQVALGTARGLAYLHEQCRERIIHCDIKPENILLDESYRPKVADFGMAKLVARDLSRVLTTMRGTIGYLAPEWITALPITPKADVYSFGMVLFELVSGKRNTEMVGDGTAAAVAAEYFPLLAAVEMSDRGDVLRLLDRRLAGDADVEELTRACMAACWCVQDEESCRPRMGEVVRILEGVVVAARPPIPRSLQYIGEFGEGSLYYLL